MRLRPQQRFSKAHPCPICGGYDQQRRGVGKRCHGFLSDDGRYAHCTREEFAGALERNQKSETFAHRLDGPCECGQTHGPARAVRAVTKQTRKLVSSWSYRAADGSTELYRIDRFEMPNGKTYSARRPAPPGWDGCQHRAKCRSDGVWCVDGWLSTLKERPCSAAAELCLYNQSCLEVQDRSSEPVQIPEGERCADALIGLGLLAVTNPFGAGKGKWLPRFSQKLVNRHAMIWADADGPGRSFAEEKARSLGGKTKSTKIVDLYPDRTSGSDVADWIAERRAVGMADDAIRAELEALIAQAAEWQPAGHDDPETSPPTSGRGVSGEVSRGAVREFSFLTLRQTAQGEGFELPFLPFLDHEEAHIICKLFATLIAAYAKAGKTSLLFELARQWATRGCRILYFTEEPEIVWKARILAASVNGLDRMVGVPSLGADPALLLQRMRAGDEEIVIVDTTNLLGISDGNDSATVCTVLTPWVEAARAGAKTIIFAHHTNKSIQGDLKAVAGSYNFAAVVDCVLLLRPDAAPNRRTLGGLARVFAVEPVMYELHDGRLRFLGGPQAVEFEAVVAACVRLLGMSPGDKKKTAEVLDELGDPKPSLSHVQQALALAAGRGGILRDPPIGEGSKPGKAYRWWVPEAETSPPTPLPLVGGEVGGSADVGVPARPEAIGEEETSA